MRPSLGEEPGVGALRSYFLSRAHCTEIMVLAS